VLAAAGIVLGRKEEQKYSVYTTPLVSLQHISGHRLRSHREALQRCRSSPSHQATLLKGTQNPVRSRGSCKPSSQQGKDQLGLSPRDSQEEGKG